VFEYVKGMEGKLITAARALLGWSQDDLAKRAKVSRPTLAGIEREDGNPKRATERAVVSALEAEGIAFEESPDRVGVFLKRKSD